MKIRRFSVVAMCLVLSSCALVFSAEYDQNGILSLLRGDLNRDGYINLPDIGMLASAWLEQDCDLSNTCAGADIYPECGDGAINFGDYDGLAGVWGSCTDPCDPCCTPVALTLYEPPTTAWVVPTEMVSLFSGEFYKSQTDMLIPGRGIDFALIRTYRSRTGTNTLWGNNWDFSYNIHIEACSGNIIVHNGRGRRDIYYAQPNGTWVANGFFRELIQEMDGSFTMLFRDTGKWKFNSFDATNAPGKINAIVDRNSNTMTFDYDAFGRLVTIHTSLDSDSHNRDITIAYNASGMVESVSDWTGRQVRYEYYGPGDPNGSAGDLKSVTTPAVIGTPTGNDFPGGKKTVYTYSKDFADDRLNHNLLTITDPNGKTYLRNSYSMREDPNHRDFDRVHRQILGEPNDIIDIRYRRCSPTADNYYAVMIAIVNDRTGNVRHYYFDQHNRLVLRRDYTGRANPDQFTDLVQNRPIGRLRPADPEYFVTRFQYNEDHLPVWIKYPNRNYTVIVYQGDLEPNAPPRSRGNLREIHRYAGPLAPVSDQDKITALFFYDTDSGDPCGFNVLVRSVDLRGNEKLYDHDNKGNRTRTTYKIPWPKPDIVVDYTYDTHGRLTSKLHPDNGSGCRRLDEYKYYTNPNDPNFGYLKNIIIDSNNLALTTTYKYDRFGNVICVIDPNGNDMQLIRNQLGQVVKQISRQVSSGIRYETDIHYDIKDNVVHVARQNIDEEGKSQANSYIDIFVEVDILNNPTRVTREVDLNHSIVTEFEYDDNYNRTLTRLGEATNDNQPNNTVRIKRDERNLVFQITRAEGDPCQSTTQYDYDLNGNLKKVIQGLEGIPRITIHNHDGFNRRRETNDAMGNVSKYGYDAAGNLVSASRFGELLDVEGSAGNTRIADAVYLFDSMNRCIRIERPHFDPNTQTPIGDGNSVKQLFYSDNGLLTQTIDDNGNQTDYKYDSAGRLSTIIDAKDNIRIFRYDKNSNIIKLIEVDKSDVDDSNETFVTDFVRDGLGQVTRRIIAGNITEYGYNSQGKCTLITDALNNQTRCVYNDAGWLIKTIRDMDGDGADPNDANDIVTQYAYDDSGRRISFTDDNGNITSSEYDALNRKIREVYADGTERKVGYDALGNQNVAMDADGDFVVSIYDKLDRLTNKIITPGPETAHTTTFEEYKYDGGSKLVYAGNDSSIVTFKHDSHSNLAEETLNGQKTSYSYDGAGNRLSLTYPGGRKIDYVYDALNLPSIVIDGQETSLTNKYIGPRRLAQADYGNGTRTIYQYDGMKERFNPPGDFGVKQIIKTKHLKVSDGSIIDEQTYKWDPVGNKKQQKDIRLGGPRLTHDYIYDRAYRLIQTTVTDGNSVVVRQTSYDRDGVGNLKEVIGSPDPSPWVGTYIMDPTLPEPGDFPMNQYTFTPFDNRQYSKDGNTTIIDNDDTGYIEIKYDCHNQMVEHTNIATGERHTYSYDALGRRTAKVVDADGIAGGPFETHYLYSGRQVVEEQGGATPATYVYGYTEEDYCGLHDSPGDDQFIMTRGGQDYYYHRDDIGSVMAVTDNTKVVERYRYADYGFPTIISQGAVQESSTIDSPLMFRGKRYDFETGLYNLTLDTTVWTKSFDPQSGRFIQRHGGDALGNRYTAFGNNPGRDQALSIIAILVLLNRPSSVGLTIGGWNDGGVFMPTQAGAGGDVFGFTASPAVGVAASDDTCVWMFGSSGMVVNAAALLQSAFPDYPLNLMPPASGASYQVDTWYLMPSVSGASYQVDTWYLMPGQGSPPSLFDADDQGYFAWIYDQGGDVDGDDFLIWQTGLSGSRGDDVWLFGGLRVGGNPLLADYGGDDGLRVGRIANPLNGPDNFAIVGRGLGTDDELADQFAGSDFDLYGFHFYPILNFTDVEVILPHIRQGILSTGLYP